MEHPVEYGPKGAGVFGMGRIHQRLSLEVEKEKQDPWAAEEGNQSIEEQKRAKGGFLLLSLRPIKPQQLGNADIGDRSVACIKYECIKDA